MECSDVDRFRHEFKHAGTLTARVYAFMRLTDDPDLRWSDLIEGLKCGGFIAERSSMLLQYALHIKAEASQSHEVSAFWEDKLSKTAKNLDSRVELKQTKHLE